MTVSTSSLDVRVLVFFAALLCLGGMVAFIVVPASLRFTTWFEALTLLMEGIGEYTGHHRLVWLGCLALVLGIAGCCVVGLVASGALLTCNGNNPAQLCRLIGR